MEKTNRVEMMPKTLFLAATLALALAACGPSATTSAPPSDAPAAETEAEPAKAEVTMAQYEQLSEGMTVAEVEAILGAGEEISSTDVGGISTVMYAWEGTGDLGANMNAMFQDGKLISKSQFGLK